MFYENLVRLLKEKGVTKAKFSSDLGIGKNQIKYWEKNGNIPKGDVLKKIADYFGVTTATLLGYIDIDSVPNLQSVDELVVFEEIGVISAGYDGQAIEEHTGKKIDLPTSMLKGHKKEDFFVLRVKGNSMYPKLIDGDSILCQRCSSVDSGDTAVVLYDGDEATVKQVNYVSGEDWLELIPVNPEYETKRIEGLDLEQCRVLGKVVKLIRDF